MINVSRIKDSQILSVETDGQWESAEIEAATMEMQAVINHLGTISVLERNMSPGTGCCLLFWDQVADAFAPSAVSQVAVVADQSRIDIFSSLFRYENDALVRHFSFAQYSEALSWLRRCEVHRSSASPALRQNMTPCESRFRASMPVQKA